MEEYVTKTLGWLLIRVHDLEPLLYWLYRPIPAKDAEKYFSCLQHRLVIGGLRELGVDGNLRFGVDLLLRMIINAPTEIPTEPRYSPAVKNLWSACQAFSAFGINVPLPATDLADLETLDLDELIEALSSAFHERVEFPTNVTYEETRHIRLVVSLLKYLRRVRKEGEYGEIGEEITGEVEALIDSFLMRRLGVQLPHKDDENDLHDVIAICRVAWDDVSVM